MNVSRRRWPDVRRVALVSDSHGRLAAPLLAAIAGVDLIVHAGDLGSVEVMRELRRIAPLCAVRGNNDTPRQWPADEAAQCARLPEACVIELAGGALAVVHGHQWPVVATRHQRLRAAFPDARCIAYGHSHRRSLDCNDAPWVVNPGASGMARTHGGPGWIILTVSPRIWRLDAFGGPE